MKTRRSVLLGSVAFLAGCTGRRTNHSSLADLWIGNSREQSVDVTVEFYPEGRDFATVTLSIRVPTDEKITWDDLQTLDHPGLVRANLPDEETAPDELDWTGDNDIDNHGIEVIVDVDEFEIIERVS